MDQEHFAGIVKEFPQVWNRSHPHFKDKLMKERYWNEISLRCGSNELLCKDTFKALREKYLREREKSKYLGDLYIPWKLLDKLSFLEPHIILRKQSISQEETMQAAEELSSSFIVNQNDNCQSFEMKLIELVKQSVPIWDRNSKNFGSKQLKMELWKYIGQKLCKDTDYCILRWKALREKYIRQKAKIQDGECHWPFLEKMSFLDEVIQYRRKRSLDNLPPYSPQNDNSMSFMESNRMDYVGSNKSSRSYNEPYGHLNFDSESSVTDSNNDYLVPVKQEEPSDVSECAKPESRIPDSSNDPPNKSSVRKRYHTEESENSDNNTSNKVMRQDEQPQQQQVQEQTQEQLFGNLVALMLSKKSERDKNIAMLEIMKVLTN